MYECMIESTYTTEPLGGRTMSSYQAKEQNNEMVEGNAKGLAQEVLSLIGAGTAIVFGCALIAVLGMYL